MRYKHEKIHELLWLRPAGGFFDGVWSIQLAYLLRVIDSFDRVMHPFVAVKFATISFVRYKLISILHGLARMTNKRTSCQYTAD